MLFHFQFPHAEGRKCSCTTIRNFECLHQAIVFISLLNLTLGDDEAHQLSYSEDEWRTINRKIADCQQRNKIPNFFDPDVVCYHVDKNVKGWRRAKCAHCKNEFHGDSIRVWVNAKFFNIKNNSFPREPSVRYFCPKKPCFMNWKPNKLELAPPFLKNTLITSTYSSFSPNEQEALNALGLTILPAG